MLYPNTKEIDWFKIKNNQSNWYLEWQALGKIATFLAKKF